MARTLGNQYTSTVGEEIANSVSHGVMMVLALAALPFVAIWGFIQYDITAAVGLSIYSACLFLMFSISTLYHTMTEGKVKDIFHLLDHIFIYVTIASAYTPTALTIIGGAKGIILVALQWAITLFGIFYKVFVKNQNQKISMCIYLAMGWAIVLFIRDLINNSTTGFLWWIMIGGLLYTIGALIYWRKGFKYHHFVWHLFINFAAISQFIAIVFFLK